MHIISNMHIYIYIDTHISSSLPSQRIQGVGLGSDQGPQGWILDMACQPHEGSRFPRASQAVAWLLGRPWDPVGPRRRRGWRANLQGHHHARGRSTSGRGFGQDTYGKHWAEGVYGSEAWTSGRRFFKSQRPAIYATFMQRNIQGRPLSRPQTWRVHCGFDSRETWPNQDTMADPGCGEGHAGWKTMVNWQSPAKVPQRVPKVSWPERYR